MPASRRDIPLFPLGIVLYPRERLPLHIFEERYRALVADCLAQEQPFGIVMVDEGRLADVGCTARIASVIRRYPDGRLDILTRGERRFHVEAVRDETPYLRADVTYLSDDETPVDPGQRERLITMHMKLLELAGRTVRPSRYQNNPHVSYFIAHNAGLRPEQKQRVLELSSENARIAFLVEHLGRFIPRVESVEAIRQRIRTNGHLQDFPPEGLDEGLSD